MKSITVETTINAPVEKVWKAWTTPEDIVQWNNASDDWCTKKAEVDLRVGGSFSSIMAARDGSAQFDFNGVYTVVEEHKQIAYKLVDERKVAVSFAEADGKTNVTETFDLENENSEELQRAGWQAILDNFKKHVERS